MPLSLPPSNRATTYPGSVAAADNDQHVAASAELQTHALWDTQLGQPNGVATLDGAGRITPAQAPGGLADSIHGFLASTGDPTPSGASSLLTLTGGFIYLISMLPASSAGVVGKAWFYIPLTSANVQTGTGSKLAIVSPALQVVSDWVNTDAALQSAGTDGVRTVTITGGPTTVPRNRYFAAFFIPPSGITQAAQIRCYNASAAASNMAIAAAPYRSASAAATVTITDLTTLSSWTKQPVPAGMALTV
jgi:hypothetical protein